MWSLMRTLSFAKRVEQDKLCRAGASPADLTDCNRTLQKPNPRRWPIAEESSAFDICGRHEPPIPAVETVTTIVSYHEIRVGGNLHRCIIAREISRTISNSKKTQCGIFLTVHKQVLIVDC